MALSYQEQSELMRDGVFQGRIKVAALSFSQYILNELPNVQGHTSRYRWAQQTAQAPDSMAQQLQPLVVMDGAVQSAGANVTDAALQSAVEGVVSKLF